MATQKTVRFMQGNEAVVEGALMAGCRFFAGYPITPASEITEGMSIRLPPLGGVFLQMEDEIASMGAVIGASMGGMKALTATSGPGFSLKQENIGVACAMEIPCVIVDVMRGGPASGMSTLPMQSDAMQARWGCHGDHPIIVLAPATVEDCFNLTVKAFNLSEKTRIPVIITSDALVGHVRERVEIPAPEDVPIFNRRKTTVPPEEYLPFHGEEDGVPLWADRGTAYRYHMCSNCHTEKGFPADSNSAVMEKMLGRLLKKMETFEEEITTYKAYNTEGADTLVIAYGSCARSAFEASDRLAAQGKKVGVLQLMSLWPFPEKVVRSACEKARTIIFPEMNSGQMIKEARLSTGKTIHGLNRFDGKIIHPQQIIDKIREVSL